ncbi:MAG: NlpC/P60 family protein [Anaerostipes sp.]|nr:NlpC/P60 family protein [Anaerostipes sp.]
MGFKEKKAFSENKGNFTNQMACFVSHEAGQFTGEENASASGSLDAAAEKAIRLSAEKNRSEKIEVKSQRNDLKESIRMDQKQLKAEEKNLTQKKAEIVKEKHELKVKQQDSRFTKEELKEHKEKIKEQERFTEKETSRISDKRAEVNEKLDKKKELKKKEDKQRKKQATKVSIGNMLRSKKDISNELAGGGANTGDAFADAKGGLVGTLLEVVNPMHYVKAFIAKIVALIAPAVLLFTTIAMVVVIIVAILFQVLMPLKEVGDAVTGFLSIFTVDSDTFSNAAMTEEEINQIIADSGCDSTQEKVLRFALSKVGYPYSQEQRTSGTAYDCSSLAYYAWKEAGVDRSHGANYPPTAAEGARMAKNSGKCVESGDASGFSLKPGDLIYYGGSDNGRYLGIYHVAIYVGNGKAVEALNTKYGVVYQTLRTKNAIMVVRPNN